MQSHNQHTIQSCLDIGASFEGTNGGMLFEDSAPPIRVGHSGERHSWGEVGSRGGKDAQECGMGGYERVRGVDGTKLIGLGLMGGVSKPNEDEIEDAKSEER